MRVCLYVCKVQLHNCFARAGENDRGGEGGGKIDTQLNKKNECNWKCVNFTTAPVTPHSLIQ